jgi:hypothetical protein
LGAPSTADSSSFPLIAQVHLVNASSLRDTGTASIAVFVELANASSWQSTDAATAVFCAAFDATSDYAQPRTTLDILRQRHFSRPGRDSSGALVTLSALSASARYNVFCTALSPLGVHAELDATRAASRLLTVSTPCCKVVTV